MCGIDFARMHWAELEGAHFKQGMLMLCAALIKHGAKTFIASERETEGGGKKGEAQQKLFCSSAERDNELTSPSHSLFV